MLDDHHDRSHGHDDNAVIMFGSACMTMSFVLFMPMMLVHAAAVPMDSSSIAAAVGGLSIDTATATPSLAIAAVDFQAIIAKASSRALDGGTAGASAAAIQGITSIYTYTCTDR